MMEKMLIDALKDIHVAMQFLEDALDNIREYLEMNNEETKKIQFDKTGGQGIQEESN